MTTTQVVGTPAARYPVTPRTLPPDDPWIRHVTQVAIPAAEARGDAGLVALYRRIVREARG